MKKSLYKSFFLIAICFLYGCTEPYALQSDTFENILVVEATLTNELKKQEIKLSRTYPLEENGIKIEKGATVYVVDDNGNRYDFQENNNLYISQTAFQAQANKSYELHIETSDGKVYISDKQKLTTISPITDAVAEVITKDGKKGVQISVKSFDPSNTSKYYRFEYEETYKIIAPKWTPVKAIAVSNTAYELIPRITEAKICYGNQKSNTIMQTATNTQTEDRVNFPVRFIDNKNYIIGNRYSILVKQYVQNLQAFTYYKTLSNLSGNQNLLSQNQPGFINGNIKSLNNPNEKTVGFFEVSSVSEKRIFFNFIDLFPNDIPEYITDCEEDPRYPKKFHYLFCFDPRNFNCEGVTFMRLLQENLICYYSNNSTNITAFDIKCGDCSSFASNIKPAFWID